MSKAKKFDQEQGSVDADLSKSSKEIKAKYRKNRRIFALDYLSIQKWGREGFTSQPNEEDVWSES